MNIFISKNSMVRLNPGKEQHDTIFVCFCPWTPSPTITRKGWGEDFLKQRAYPALHIIPGKNTWYQSDDDTDAIKAATEVAKRYRRVITYGSSMGGYAALNFARQLNAAVVISVMPQYSISRTVAPFETRWSSEASQISFQHHHMDEFEKNSCESFVFYDPFYRPDKQHVDLIAPVTNCTRIPLALSGHNGPGANVLKEVITLAFTGATQEIPRRSREIYQSNKRQDANYLMQIARQARHLGDASRIELLRRAQKITPHNIKIDISLSELFVKSRDYSNALTTQDNALVKHPGNSLMHSHRAAVLNRIKRWDEAAAASEIALRLSPDNAYFHHQRASILVNLDRLTDAKLNQERAMLLDPLNEGFKAQQVAICTRLAQQPLPAATRSVDNHQNPSLPT